MQKRSRRALSAIILLGVLLSACSTAAPTGRGGPTLPPPATPAPDLPAADFPELDALLQAPADPLNLEITVDESLTVSAVLSYEGGALTASGGDGTTYTLEIPEGALYAPTQIRMTPLDSVGGLPSGEGAAYAVQLEPDGLRLSDVAILTITTPEEIPLEEQVFFTYQGDDNEFAFAPPIVDSPALQIMITHFSGYGVDKGLLADTEPVRRRIAGDTEARLSSILSDELARYRQQELLGTATPQDDADFQRFWAWYVNTYYYQVVKPRLDAARESCAAGRVAMQTFLGFERMLTLIGAPAGWNTPAELSSVRDAVTSVCLQEEYELCRDQHIVHRIISVLLSLLRQQALLGMDDGGALEARGDDLVRKCLTFELDFESTARTVTPGVETTAESVVEANVPLHFSPGGELGSIEGEAALINRSFSIASPNCSLTASRGGSTLHIGDLQWEVDFRDAHDQLGYVRDIVLTFSPDPTTESWTGTCTIGPTTFPYDAESANVWSSTWGGVRAEACLGAAGAGSGGDGASPPIPSDLAGMMEILGQIDASGTLSPEQMQQLAGAVSGQSGAAGQAPGMVSGCGVERDWDVRGGDIFATREWSLSSSMGVSMSENGSMILRHTPQ